MNKQNKGISLFVIVLFLAGITTAFVTVHGSTYFYGTVYDSASSPNEISGAFVMLTDSQFNILGSETTNSNGDYGFSTTLTGNTPYTFTVTKTGFDNEYKEVSGGGENDFNLEGDGEKLAYLFYAEDVTSITEVSSYRNILVDEEYEVEIIPNCADVESKCEDIDDDEIYADTIFVWVCGHGNNTGGHSYTYFASEDGSKTWSYEFKGWMDDWEAERKCILVDSCFSGDWADDFAETPYLAMSSADENHIAYRDGSGDECYFSDKFFFYVGPQGQTAVQSYNSARLLFDDENDDWPSYPKKQDYSSYTWLT